MKESKWIITPYHALCSIDSSKSNINGHDVDEDDFITNKYDHDSKHAEPYACADMRCDVYDKIPEGVLEKYEISEGDWYIIAHEIQSAVSFGSCGWCV